MRRIGLTASTGTILGTLAGALLAAGLLTATPAAAAEAIRKLQVELKGDPASHFAVENLAGTMRVVPGTGKTVVAIATVHAESDDLAAAVTFEQVTGKKGEPVLRVRYPLDKYSTIRFATSQEGGFLTRLIGAGCFTNTEYDGHKVKVSGNTGALVYADVEVQLPRGPVDAKLKNLVGNLTGRDVAGTLLFDSASGNIDLEKISGDVKADTGSGDVKARDIEGTFSCDTGSGDCDVRGFKGEEIGCDTGSGNINLENITARVVNADTGSGDVRAVGTDLETFKADTGSGDVRLENPGARLLRVKADTGSGDVVLRLAADASFEALANQGSGEILVHYKDAQPILKNKVLLGYRRGDAKIRIDVDTGSGDLTIEPAS
jgi:DUF4097 and DUF4098 domain-containing protein YvlB